MPRTPAQNEALRQQRKAQIMDAALTAYALRGYDGADIDDIAARAGVAKGLMYYYYKTKRALFCELFDVMFAQSDALSRQWLQSGGERALEALLRYCYGLFEQTRRDPRTVQFCMRVPFDAFAVFGAEGWREGAARAMTHRAALERLIARAMEQGDVPPGDARMLAGSFWTVFVANLFDFSKLMLGQACAGSAAFAQVTAFGMGGLGVSPDAWRPYLDRLCKEGGSV